MTDINTTIHTLRALNGDLRQARPAVLEAVASLEHALSCLRGLDDPHARNAEADVSAALADLREAHAIWMDEYARRAEDLSRRLAS
jgi:hypothetical protein